MTVGLFIPTIQLQYKNCVDLSFRRRRNPIEIWIGFLLRRNDKTKFGIYKPTVIYFKMDGMKEQDIDKLFDSTTHIKI